MLGYRNLLEKLAEKFHTTPETLVALNDGGTILRAGTLLRLPNVLPASRNHKGVDPERAALLNDFNLGPREATGRKVVVDKSDGALRVFDDKDRLIAQFPATMGSKHDPLPIGKWTIKGTAYLPPFHFQPELFWDVADDEAEQELPPGPNGPVGVAWLELSKENYGIHGTPEPQLIGRSESHGCIRLTNWDVLRLAQLVKPGTPAILQP